MNNRFIQGAFNKIKQITTNTNIENFHKFSECQELFLIYLLKGFAKN